MRDCLNIQGIVVLHLIKNLLHIWSKELFELKCNARKNSLIMLFLKLKQTGRRRTDLLARQDSKVVDNNADCAVGMKWICHLSNLFMEWKPKSKKTYIDVSRLTQYMTILLLVLLVIQKSVILSSYYRWGNKKSDLKSLISFFELYSLNQNQVDWIPRISCVPQNLYRRPTSYIDFW